MDRLILAGNETLTGWMRTLDLVTDIPGGACEVSWELDRYDVMDIQGKLKEQNISLKKGVLVKLNAVLTYTANEKSRLLISAWHVYPKKPSGEESTKKDVEEANKKSRYSNKRKEN